MSMEKPSCFYLEIPDTLIQSESIFNLPYRVNEDVENLVGFE